MSEEIVKPNNDEIAFSEETYAPISRSLVQIAAFLSKERSPQELNAVGKVIDKYKSALKDLNENIKERLNLAAQAQGTRVSKATLRIEKVVDVVTSRDHNPAIRPVTVLSQRRNIPLERMCDKEVIDVPSERKLKLLLDLKEITTEEFEECYPKKVSVRIL